LGGIAALVQLGLAVLGWGGVAPFVSHPPLVAIVVLTIVLTAAAAFTEGNVSSGEREDRENRWVIAVIGLLGFPLAYVPAYTDRHDLWTLDGDTVRWIGVALFVIGGILRLWPVFVLGRRFSGLVAIQQEHRLVTTGIYRFVRNPSYVGLLVGSLGWALAFRSGAGVVITALFLVPLVARIRSEERLLSDHFGAEYESYRQRTWRLLPGIY
jgi:protein-S-isoprenylcysteine O-methyltransferase Ste14